MSLDTLRDFVTRLEAAGELVRVDRPVSVVREIAEIADRCMKAPDGGPALLFTRPTLAGGGACAIPVAINLFGSRRRMALALGVGDLDEIGAAEQIAALDDHERQEEEIEQAEHDAELDDPEPAEPPAGPFDLTPRPSLPTGEGGIRGGEGVEHALRGRAACYTRVEQTF